MQFLCSGCVPGTSQVFILLFTLEADILFLFEKAETYLPRHPTSYLPLTSANSPYYLIKVFHEDGVPA